MASKIRADVKVQIISGTVIAVDENDITIQLDNSGVEVQCNNFDHDRVAIDDHAKIKVSDPINIARGKWAALAIEGTIKESKMTVEMTAEVETEEVEVTPEAEPEVEVIEVAPEVEVIEENEAATEEVEVAPEVEPDVEEIEVVPEVETPAEETAPEDKVEGEDIIQSGKAGTLNWELVEVRPDEFTIRIHNKAGTESFDIIERESITIAKAFLAGFVAGRKQTFDKVKDSVTDARESM